MISLICVLVTLYVLMNLIFFEIVLRNGYELTNIRSTHSVTFLCASINSIGKFVCLGFTDMIFCGLFCL